MCFSVLFGCVLTKEALFARPLRNCHFVFGVYFCHYRGTRIHQRNQTKAKTCTCCRYMYNATIPHTSVPNQTACAAQPTSTRTTWSSTASLFVASADEAPPLSLRLVCMLAPSKRPHKEQWWRSPKSPMPSQQRSMTSNCQSSEKNSTQKKRGARRGARRPQPGARGRIGNKECRTFAFVEQFEEEINAVHVDRSSKASSFTFDVIDKAQAETSYISSKSTET